MKHYMYVPGKREWYRQNRSPCSFDLACFSLDVADFAAKIRVDFSPDADDFYVTSSELSF